MTIKYIETTASKIPLELLLQADPDEDQVRSYLDSARVFAVVKESVVIGICVVGPVSEFAAEIFNVSIEETFQKKGFGTRLLLFVLSQLKSRKLSRVEVGTGTFGYQLTYYQRLGFRVDSIIKNYFVRNYSEPIYDSGIQLKDMLRLYLDLDEWEVATYHSV